MPEESPKGGNATSPRDKAIGDRPTRHRQRIDELRSALEAVSAIVIRIAPDGTLFPLNSSARRLLEAEGITSRTPLSRQRPEHPFAAIVAEALGLREVLTHGKLRPSPTRLRHRHVRLRDQKRYRIDGVLALRRGVAGDPILEIRRIGEQADRDLSIFASRHRLTTRELAVLEELLAGVSSEGICRCLGISSHTMRTHLRHIFEKTRCHSRAQLVARAVSDAGDCRCREDLPTSK